MKPLYHEQYWEVEIEWSRPKEYDRLLEEGSHHDESAHLYLISARYRDYESKLLYIGKTYDQWVSKRLSQKDHRSRYGTFQENYPNHIFFVSHGVITINGSKITRKRLSDIERILIYTNEPQHAHNVQNYYSHGVIGSYLIENKGSKCTLPSVISLGIFVKY